MCVFICYSITEALIFLKWFTVFVVFCKALYWIFTPYVVLKNSYLQREFGEMLSKVSKWPDYIDSYVNFLFRLTCVCVFRWLIIITNILTTYKPPKNITSKYVNSLSLSSQIQHNLQQLKLMSASAVWVDMAGRPDNNIC